MSANTEKYDNNCSSNNPHGEPVLLGVIGGSGIYRLDALRDAKCYTIKTPFGSPSSDICVANVHGITCAFLPRHGAQHTLNPSEVNYRANIYAMKILGVQYMISIYAVGSLDEAYRPGDLVLVDQIIDRTTGRQSTFYENGIVAHVDYAYPISATFRNIARDVIRGIFFASDTAEADGGWKLHEHATVVTMEGPQFSTRAESLWNKQIGGHLIGMTGATEAKLAREAEIAYLALATVTDMDAWSDAPHVDAISVRQVFAANVEKLQKCVPEIVAAVGAEPFVDPAHAAMQHAVCTKEAAVTQDVRQRLAPLLAKYTQFSP